MRLSYIKVRTDIACTLRQLFLFCIFIFLFSACRQSEKDCSHLYVAKEDKQWIEKFFHDLLFKEGGAYTLWGSKPITEIVAYHYSDEEMIELMRQLPEEELKSCYKDEQYDFPENWERWEAICINFPFHKHLLFRAHFSEDRKMSYIYFVDIIKTALLIQDNYDLFRREIGFEFHPLEVVLEMPKQSSEFWKRLRKSPNSSLLWGLLFGYGKQNSSLFNWKYQNLNCASRDFIDLLSQTSSNPSPEGHVRLSIDAFLLPSFISFTEEDEVLSKYKNEREKIREIYKNKDLLKITLEELMGKASSSSNFPGWQRSSQEKKSS